MPTLSMDEIIPGLWLGNWKSSLDFETLKSKNIMSILSMLPGDLPVREGFIRCQIPVNDDPDEDILVHLPRAVNFIKDQLEKGRGVLVHCMGGISRSPTAVAAYLMYTRNLDAQQALKLVRSKRFQIGPNEGFEEQLHVYRAANFVISQECKEVRMFYMERAMKGVMYGHAPQPDMDMFADAPAESQTPAPVLRRRIRCKMCRQELAAREHMLDHGQLGPSPTSIPSPPLSSSLEVLSSHSAVNSNVSSTTPEIVDTKQDSTIPGNLPSTFTNGNANGDATQAPVSASQSEPKLYATSASLNAGLMANPQLAALRGGFPIPSPQQNTASPIPPSPPIPVLSNPSCSGYFLEPMKWMEFFLSEGQLAGKIACPNTKCGAKLGNYDWAGIHCGCKQWVVPGFCINRSKVDEVIG